MIPKIIFLNLNANNGRASKKWIHLTHHTNHIQEKDIIYDSLIFSEDIIIEVKNIMQQHIKKGHRHFVAAGGDGTVNLLINSYALLSPTEKESVIIGAIGLGSSNDFHKPSSKYIKSFHGKIPYRLNFNKTVVQDLCVARFNNKKTFFIINAALGLTASGNNYFNRNGNMIRWLKSIHIELAILYASLIAFLSYKNYLAEISIMTRDGHKIEKEISLSNFAIIKNRFFAGSLHYPNGPKTNDGFFYIYAFFGLTTINIVKNFILLYRGTIKRENNGFIQEISNSISCKSDHEFPFESDGEVFYTSHVTFQIENKGITICL